MATHLVINRIRSIQLSDVYVSDNGQKQQGANEYVRVLRIQGEEGEVRISLSAPLRDAIELSYPKR